MMKSNTQKKKDFFFFFQNQIMCTKRSLYIKIANGCWNLQINKQTKYVNDNTIIKF